MASNRRAVLEELRRKARPEVLQRAQLLRNEIVQELSKPGQGRTYGNHRASRPGDPPAVDTGRLRQSISVQEMPDGRVRVGTNVEYAPFLEFGTRRIAPRPFMRTATARFKRR